MEDQPSSIPRRFSDNHPRYNSVDFLLTLLDYAARVADEANTARLDADTQPNQ